jgi:hypothetical protein
MAVLSERVWRAILVMGMLITGSINTLSKRAQNQSFGKHAAAMLHWPLIYCSSVITYV